MSAKEEAQLTEIEKKVQAKQEWARKMRLKFTNEEMRDVEGNLNLDYFAPKALKIRAKWGDKQKDLLLEGLAKHGVGYWQAIRNEFLNEWQENELRVKSSVLIGRQNLTAYKGWKPVAEQIERERSKNFEVGQRLGCWKGGYLVADDAGTVIKELEQLDAELRAEIAQQG